MPKEQPGQRQGCFLFEKFCMLKFLKQNSEGKNSEDNILK